MKKVIISLTAIVVIITLVSSCRKDDKLSNLNDLFDNFKAANQSSQQLFTINSATGGTIIGARGSKIVFPPNALVNLNGTAFTGDAIISLKECLKKSEWIMEGLSAANKNDILISGGMLNIKVTRKDNGVELMPAPAMQVADPTLANVIKAEVPKNNNVDAKLQLFLPDSTNGALTVDPSLPPTGWRAAPYYPFGYGANSYIFQIPSFNWVNCDGLYAQPGTRTTIKVTPDLTSFVGATDMQAMLVYRNLSTVVTLPPHAGGYFESYLLSIPEGSTADVVCIGKAADGKILFKVLPATTFTTLMNISITPAIATAAEVSAYLASVNN